MPKRASAVLSQGLARSAVYETASGTLFVPTEDMWRIHEASKPKAVLHRLGQAASNWCHWQKVAGPLWPKVYDWLYTHRPAETLTHNRPAKPEDAPPDGFQPTAGMLEFRRATTIHAICAVVKRSQDDLRTSRHPRLSDQITNVLVDSWFRKHEALPWFRPWLLCGEDAPSGVRVASMQQVRWARRAWDLTAHWRAAGLTSSRPVRRWVEEGMIPSIAWLRWLYGALVPERVFVIPPRLERVKSARTDMAIYAAIGMSNATVYNWEHKSTHRAALKNVQAAVANGKEPSGEDWGQLPAETKRRMLGYAKAGTLYATLKRAGLEISHYKSLLKDAGRLGVREDLEGFLDTKSRGGRERFGFLAPALFRPSPPMCAFREAAMRASGGSGVMRDLAPDLVDAWFLDWALPQAKWGQRVRLQESGQAADTNPVAPITELSKEAVPPAPLAKPPGEAPPPPETEPDEKVIGADSDDPIVNAEFPRALAASGVPLSPEALALTTVQKGYIIWVDRARSNTAAAIRDWWTETHPEFIGGSLKAAANYVAKGVKRGQKLIERLRQVASA